MSRMRWATRLLPTSCGARRGCAVPRSGVLRSEILRPLQQRPEAPWRSVRLLGPDALWALRNWNRNRRRSTVCQAREVAGLMRRAQAMQHSAAHASCRLPRRPGFCKRGGMRRQGDVQAAAEPAAGPPRACSAERVTWVNASSSRPAASAAAAARRLCCPEAQRTSPKIGSSAAAAAWAEVDGR